MQVSRLQQELFNREGDGNNGDPGPSSRTTADPLDPTCLGCGEPGHMSQDCPALSTSASRTAAWKTPALEPSGGIVHKVPKYGPADQKRGDRRGDGTYVGLKKLGKERSKVIKELRRQAAKARRQMWNRSPASRAYQKQYREELKQLNFLTRGAVWQNYNQQFKARFTPKTYREYKLAVVRKYRATKTVEELRAQRHRSYIREREARASDPDHHKALEKVSSTQTYNLIDSSEIC
ncbi:uncharacterized protein UBRO2_03515 [Ustilago bromivora]|uniref:CCHC-type domain-containing protein n=1 Tax=Ustilago bromivora TaxID=307758 RepID=A0A8H8QN55_9BASI|nr:uncharacterized protein UBRO2_03515 [Ustilago bromivora]